jgi:hypothetical protein
VRSRRAPPRKASWLYWSGIALLILAVAAAWTYYLTILEVISLRGPKGTESAAVALEPKKEPGPAPAGTAEGARVPSGRSAAAVMASSEPPAARTPSREPPSAPGPSPRPSPGAAASSASPPAAPLERRPVQAEPPSPRQPRLPPEPPAPRQVAAGGETNIDMPDGQYVMGPLVNSSAARLTGKVRSLKVGPVEGGSTLDASALEAREIVFTDKIDGRSTVTVSAPGGRVEFRGPVADRSDVSVIAPGGSVTFAERGQIDGESRVTITARDVDLGGTISGAATRVVVTLTRGGALKFREIAGAARLYWRKADKADPEVRLEAGRVQPPARLTWTE